MASIHIADVGLRSVPSVLRNKPRAGSIPGLRQADVSTASELRTGAFPKPQPGRVLLLSFWDDDDALDAFEASDASERFRGGWSCRLAPLRAFGSWPGLDADVPNARHVEHEGPVVVFTMARWRWTRVVPFLRESAKAEHAAVAAEGLRWGTASTLPPFAATVSVWDDSKSAMTYAFGGKQPAHRNAIDVDAKKPFHHQQAFIRFRPYAERGSLGGRNPLRASIVAS
jgi:hypothetical protein